MSSLILAFALIQVLGAGMMIIDKQKAKKQAYRIPEKTLFVVAGMGGALTMFLTMHLVRHKVHTWYFFWGLPLLALVHLWLGVWVILL